MVGEIDGFFWEIKKENEINENGKKKKWKKGNEGACDSVMCGGRRGSGEGEIYIYGAGWCGSGRGV